MNNNSSNMRMDPRQRGAALATTMVFLVVLTVIGVSSMQNNRQEQKMTTNIQELNHAFQYGESGLVPGLRSPDLLLTTEPIVSYDNYMAPDIWLCPDSTDASLPGNCSTGSNHGNAAVFTRYRGKGTLPPVNFSLDSGFVTHFFYVSSRGRSRDTQSTHDVGVALIGPDDLAN